MTKRGSVAGAWVLSARFLTWARANGRTQIIDAVAEARADYKASGADSSRYEKLSDEDLKVAREKADVRRDRLEAEGARRAVVEGEDVDPPAPTG